MTFLCDTNIISELARPQPNLGVLAWSAQVSSISLSVITLEEIAYGLASKPNARVQNWFQEFLKTYCQIIPITAEIAHYSGELRGRLRTQGKSRTQATHFDCLELIRKIHVPKSFVYPSTSPALFFLVAGVINAISCKQQRFAIANVLLTPTSLHLRWLIYQLI